MNKNKGCIKPVMTAQDIEYMLINSSEGDYDNFKKKCKERWFNLIYLQNIIDKRRHESNLPDDYIVALNWVKGVLEDNYD